MQQIAQKAAQESTQEGTLSSGLQVIADLEEVAVELGLKSDAVPGLPEANGILQQHDLRKSVPGPSHCSVWYFDAKVNDTDVVRSGWFIHEDGTMKQRLVPRATEVLERWWQNGCRGAASYRVMNNINQEITYDVTCEEHSQMIQRPRPDQGMIGNARRVWRKAPGQTLSTGDRGGSAMGTLHTKMCCFCG